MCLCLEIHVCDSWSCLKFITVYFVTCWHFFQIILMTQIRSDKMSGLLWIQTVRHSGGTPERFVFCKMGRESRKSSGKTKLNLLGCLFDINSRKICHPVIPAYPYYNLLRLCHSVTDSKQTLAYLSIYWLSPRIRWLDGCY